MQRRVFRIEEMMSVRRRVAHDTHGPRADERTDASAHVEQELAAMRAAIARAKAELAGISPGDADETPLSRAQTELTAAIASMETGTDHILKAAEGADEAARNLVATLHDEYKRGLAQDILDHVIRIYEHCNFQDLTGQRINKAIGTLRMVEERLARIAQMWSGSERRSHHDGCPPSSLLNGPKLDGDHGHATQSDIDRMFA